MCSFVEGVLGIVLFIFNIFMGLAGITLIAIAAVIAVEFRDYAEEELFESKYLWGPVGLAIGFGFTLIWLSIFGIGGLCGKKRKMIQLYLIFLGVFMGVEIAFVTSTFTSRSELQSSAEKSIRAAIPSAYNTTDNTKTMKAIDELQKEFDCCGGYNVMDYTNRAPEFPLAVPDSCCPAQTGCTASSAYAKGCGQALLDKFEDHSTGQVAVGITFLALQVLAIGFGWYRLNKGDCENYV